MAHMGLSYLETDTADDKYRFYDEGKYSIAPSLHSVCRRATESWISLRSISHFGSAILPALDVEIKGNLYASSDKYLLSEALQHL